MLTSRGWGVLGAAGALGVAADLFGIGELYALAAAAVAVVAYAALGVSLRRWRIEVTRQVRPARIEAGQTPVVDLTLRNRSSGRSPILRLRDPLDDGAQTTELLVAPLRAGEERRGSYRLSPIGRGVRRLGPLTLEATDPFGLARRTRSSTVVSTFVVHPHIEVVRPPRVGGGLDGGRSPERAPRGRAYDEFASLREYQVGDDVRRMHWASTARTDTLIVREDQAERPGQLSVVLDARSRSWTAPGFEQAVSAAASILAAALDAGRPARLATTDGTDSGHGVGAQQRARILDLLAAVRTHDPVAEDGATPTPGRRGVRRPPEGTVVVVTSQAADLDEVCRLLGLGRGIDLVAVIIESGLAGGSAPTRRRAQRTVRVAAGGSLRAVWDRSA